MTERHSYLSEVGTTNDNLTPSGDTENTLSEGRSQRVLEEPVHIQSDSAERNIL
jgi:hypothetical protein